jgi:hypothetical protein
MSRDPQPNSVALEVRLLCTWWGLKDSRQLRNLERTWWRGDIGGGGGCKYPESGSWNLVCTTSPPQLRADTALLRASIPKRQKEKAVNPDCSHLRSILNCLIPANQTRSHPPTPCQQCESASEIQTP